MSASDARPLSKQIIIQSKLNHREVGPTLVAGRMRRRCERGRCAHGWRDHGWVCCTVFGHKPVDTITIPARVDGACVRVDAPMPFSSHTHTHVRSYSPIYNPETNLKYYRSYI
jgi:hypothetical protein